MSAICLLDTSVFCELLAISGKSQQPGEFRAEFAQKKQAGESVFLPLAALLETGNHVGQMADPERRRQHAIDLVRHVRAAMDGEEPFLLFRPPTLAEVGRWLVDLPDWTARHRSGLGDLTIRHEWQQLCRQNRKRRVYVWSKDRHLQECDSER